MINDLAKRSYEGLVKELNTFDDMSASGAQHLKIKLTRIFAVLKDLRTQLPAFGSLKEEDEIQFFKNWKPAIVARYYFENEIFRIRAKMPRQTVHWKAYYDKELSLIEAFHAKHRFMRDYYDTQADEMDGLLFMREVTSVSPLWVEAPDLDTQFSTPADGLMAKFKCNDLLRDFLLAELQALDKAPTTDSGQTQESKLQWTGESVNFVELAYGLWLTGQFNHGQANLNQIVRWLEGHWGIPAGMHRRTFAEIKRRKRVSITHFLDQMKTAFMDRIQATDL